jgi:osmotically-inducible protein OsmY
VRHVLIAALLFSTAGSSVGCAAAVLRQSPRTDDLGIERLTSLRFSADARLCRYAITVAVHARTARLEGKVSSEVDRRRADQVAREAGATRVEDLLIIDPAAGESAAC